MIDRREDEAVAWAEQVIGGKVVHRHRQVRWRPHVFLEIDVGSSDPARVILRGFRNPGYMLMEAEEEKGRLMYEADILKALQGVPARTPKFFGKNEELGWLLMEWVEGDAVLTDIVDEDRRFEIYNTYMEQLAILHAHPISDIALPQGIKHPSSSKAFAQEALEREFALYRTANLPYPEPIFQIAFQWSTHNEMPSERPLCLGLVDTGPNQFLFENNRITSLMDVELAIICDPLMEMGMMRSRDVSYHTGRMTEHLRYYGDCYEKLTGIPLDIEALKYWTIAGPLIWNVPTIIGAQNPNPRIVDMAFLFAYEVLQKRCLVEALAEQFGVRLTRPELPEPQELTMMTTLHTLMIKQCEDYYLEKAVGTEETFFAENTLSIAKSLALGSAYASHMEHDNQDELAQLLGHRPSDWKAGLMELEEDIAKDHLKDLEKRLNFLYRLEVRREHTYQPMQAATGVSHGWPISRFDS